jgi:hypothetical protein
MKIIPSNNLDEWHKFFETYKLPKLTQDEIDKMTTPNLIKINLSTGEVETGGL